MVRSFAGGIQTCGGSHYHHKTWNYANHHRHFTGSIPCGKTAEKGIAGIYHDRQRIYLRQWPLLCTGRPGHHPHLPF